MTDEKLEVLLEEVFSQEIEAPRSVVYKTREKARNRVQEKEKRREYYPLLIVLLMHTVIVLALGTGAIVLVQNMKVIIGVIGIMLVLINLPIGAYILAKIYYKDKENYKGLREEI